jgi:hypothetical protein
MTIEEQFEKIGEKSILDAEKVDCSLGQFAEGLEWIRASVADRLNMVRDEIRSNERADERA